MTDVLLLAAIASGHIVAALAPEMGVFMEWLEDRRTDRLAR